MYRRGRYRDKTREGPGNTLVPSLTAMAKEEAVVERFSERSVEVERLDFRMSDL